MPTTKRRKPHRLFMRLAPSVERQPRITQFPGRLQTNYRQIEKEISIQYFRIMCEREMRSTKTRKNIFAMTKNLFFLGKMERSSRCRSGGAIDRTSTKTLRNSWLMCRVIIGNNSPTFDDRDFAVHNGNVVCDRKQMQGKIGNNNVLAQISNDRKSREKARKECLLL